jgi:hypothetical protein
MAQRKGDSKRPVISVSLDQEDFDWIQSFGGPSQSYTASRIIKAARLAGLSLDDAAEGGIVAELVEWLSHKKSKSTRELHKVLSEFLSER